MQRVYLIFLNILTLSVLQPAFLAGAEGVIDYGLHINSIPSVESEATGLSLDAGEPVGLRRRPFTMSFSMYNSMERPFGCVLRMISEDGLAIDLMNIVDSEGIYRPQIVIGEHYAVVPALIPWNTWIDVAVNINPQGGAVTVDYNGTRVEVKAKEVEDIGSLRISFGNCPFKGFTVSSVSAVSVRDIVLMSGDRIIRNWPLLKHSGSTTYDTVCSAAAVAVNPVWLADSAISLTSVLAREYSTFVDVIYDGRNTFGFIEPDGVITLKDISTGKEEVFVPKEGKSPSNALNQAKWCNDSTILSYCIAQNLYGAFDFASCRWSSTADSDPEIIYWNVSTSWDPDRSRLYSFGGYGFYHFSNILRVFSPESPESSSSFTLDKIAPRFFASSVVVDGSLYIFGGEGTFSGNQGIVEEYFYDLYKVDLDTFEETLLWDAEEPPFGRFIPGENMVYDRDAECFYTTAITEDDFILVKISAEEPSIEQMSLPAGVRRNTNIQYTNLYMNDSQDKLYALFVQSSDGGPTTVDIMDISIPLVPTADVVFQDMMQDNRKDDLFISVVVPIAGGIVLLAGILSIIYLQRHRRKRSGTMVPEDEHYDFSCNSISLLGGFSVRSRDGKDITSHFSPTLRKLLSALILHTVKYEQGIPGEKLNQLIWDYKPEGTASNNRNVYISRLRAVLEELDGVVINTKNKFLSISLSDRVLCDFNEVVQLLYGDSPTVEDVSRVLPILLRGHLLPNMEDEWVDAFRSEYSSRILASLNMILDRKNLPDNIMLKVADSIILHDRLNERAIRTRCRICHSSGNLGSAKEAYDTFCKEYKATIGEEYGLTFKQLIG